MPCRRKSDNKTPLVYRILYRFARHGTYRPLVDLVNELDQGFVGVDVGAGYGIAAEMVGDNFSKLYLVDSDEEMASKARDKFSDRENVEVIVADARNMPIPDLTADLVYFFDSLHHIPESERAIEEAIRVLRPGGLLAIFDSDSSNLMTKLTTCFERAAGLHSEYFRREELEEVLKRLGVVIERAKVDRLGRLDLLARKC